MPRGHSRDPGHRDVLCRREASRGELGHDPFQSLEKQPKSETALERPTEVSESFLWKEDVETTCDSRGGEEFTTVNLNPRTVFLEESNRTSEKEGEICDDQWECCK